MHTPAVSPLFDGHDVAVAALGGALLGLTVAFKTATAGGVVGIAGITRGFMNRPEVRKACFIVGLILSGIFMNATYGGVEPFPPPSLDDEERALLFVRLAFGCILVGLGTSMANGCTSGHGLTGLARLSWRSWLAVPVFMAAAAITATLAGTLKALPPSADFELDAPKGDVAAAWTGCTAAFLLFAFGSAFIVRHFVGPKEETKFAVELISGFTFGMGLAISSMLRPSKVAGFLDLGSGVWDPSLAFVMGGGVCVTFPFFQIMERVIQPSSAVLGGPFELPPRTKLPDLQLVLGSSVFGVGWGICGLCPGPIWVLVAAKPCAEMAVSVVAMLTGMGAWILYQRFKTAREAAKARSEANSYVVAAAESPTTSDRSIKDTQQKA